MIHECPRCGYQTTNKSDFRLHINRRSICDPIVAEVKLDKLKEKYIKKEPVPNFVCEACKAIYSSKTGYYSHLKECPGNTLERIARLEKYVAQIMYVLNRDDVKKPKLLMNTQNDNSTPNNLGREEINHIFDDIDFMRNCFNNYEKGIIIFIRKVWFDDAYPRNKNLKPLNSKYVEFYQYNKWNKCSWNDYIRNLLDAVGRYFKFFFEKCPSSSRTFLDLYMIKIGTPLRWNLDHGAYIFKDADSVIDTEKTNAIIIEYVKRQIFKLYPNLARQNAKTA